MALTVLRLYYRIPLHRKRRFVLEICLCIILFLTAEKVWKRLEDAFSILHQVPGLKTLELYFYPYHKDLDDYGNNIFLKYYTHQWDIVYALGSNRNPLPALQSLKIYGWICCKDELMLLFDEAPIARLAASLRHLSFTLPRMESADTLESLERFWMQGVVRRVLQPAVNLESLVVTGSVRCGDAQRFDFPQLATLSLRHIIWKDDTSSQRDMVPLEFIVRHQKTLKKLELHNCAINVRKLSWPPHCYWADIYKRLANALTGLVEVKVEFNLKEDEIPYVYVTGYSFWNYSNKYDLKWRAPVLPPDAALAHDALALEEFRAVVKSQGMGNGSGFRS